MSNTTSGEVIDLRDLWRVIREGKKTIFLVTTFFLFFAIVYIFTVKPVYEVRAMVELGKINDKPLGNVNDVKEKLAYLYGLKSKKELDLPRVKAINLAKKSNNTFSVVVEGYDNNTSIAFINSMIQKMEQEYAEKTNEYINTQKGLIELTQKDIKNAENSLNKVENTLLNYNHKIINIKSEDAALAGIYTMQISQNQTLKQELQKEISMLKTKIYRLQLSISPLKIQKTYIVGSVDVLDRPVKPKKVLILIVSFITGLMFSVFLVFFFSFLREGKKVEEED